LPANVEFVIHFFLAAGVPPAVEGGILPPGLWGEFRVSSA